jgi:putative hydrolase of the HAD superfamily
VSAGPQHVALHGPEARPRAVSFDVTGTLLGLPRLGSLYAEVFARHGLDVDPASVGSVVREVWQELGIRTRLGEDRFSSHPEGAKGFWRELVGRVAARLGLPVPTPFLAAELYERFAIGSSWDVYPEVPALLATLRDGGLRLAVVSNFDARLPRLLAETALAAHFEVVVYSAEVGVEKPHPAIFEELLGALKLPPEDVLHVGDSRRDDVEGALAVGMQALWLTRGSGRGDLASLAELPRRLGLEGRAAVGVWP